MSNLNNKILHVIRILVFGDLQLCFAQTAFFINNCFNKKSGPKNQRKHLTNLKASFILALQFPVQSPKTPLHLFLGVVFFFKTFLHQSSFKKNIFQINGEVINITSLQFIPRPPLARFLILQIQCGTC